MKKEKSVQFPSAKPDLIQITALDVETGTLNLVYASETFDLSPGESRSFKQVGSKSNTATVVTIISNHGYLTDIQEVSSDGSRR